jgi:geranylgeranyl diphosphate synthase, type II
MYNHSELKAIADKAIANLTYNSEAEKLVNPVKYILSIGGKRIRPVMALMACNLYNDQIDEAIIPATGLEIFHNFTLVHDDIMDQSPLRRNFPTVHNKWDINQAILSGDVMVFIANECFLQTPISCQHKVFGIFNKAATEVCIGQQLDIDFEKATIVSQAEYLRMIELKTAVLIAASFKIGALIGGAEDKDADCLYEFGRNLGLAFQIQDDLLDIYGDMKLFGKAPGGDIVANKKTFLLVKALEVANTEQRKQLQEQYSTRESDAETKVKTVVELFDKLNVKTITENIANDYIEKAFSLLEKTSADGKRKKELTLLASSLIGRQR